MDATYGLARRPDWESRADWTPVTGWGGIQIWVVWRIGRLLGIVVASRLELYGGLDATYMLGRRPDWESRADWTPLTDCAASSFGI